MHKVFCDRCNTEMFAIDYSKDGGCQFTQQQGAHKKVGHLCRLCLEAFEVWLASA